MNDRDPFFACALSMASIVFLLIGCAQDTATDWTAAGDGNGEFIIGGGERDPSGDTPAMSYETLVDGQAARTEHIDRFWSSVGIRTTWKVDGEEFKEEADGHLIFKRAPNRIALTFGRLGKIYVWFGADEEHFWLFEQGDHPRAYIGRNENAMDPASEQLPMLVHPAELIDLLGIFDFPDYEGGPIPLVFFSRRHLMYRLRIPGEWNDRRVFLDAQSFLPRGIELIDRVSERVVARAILSDYGPMEIQGLAPGDLPLVPQVIRVWGETTAGEVEMRLALRTPRTGPPNGAIRDAAFKFRQIARTMRPKETIILDRNCANPAVVKQ